MVSAENVLYYGDNLCVLRHHVKDESVDLVYRFTDKDGRGIIRKLR